MYIIHTQKFQMKQSEIWLNVKGKNNDANVLKYWSQKLSCLPLFYLEIIRLLWDIYRKNMKINTQKLLQKMIPKNWGKRMDTGHHIRGPMFQLLLCIKHLGKATKVSLFPLKLLSMSCHWNSHAIQTLTIYFQQNTLQIQQTKSSLSI